jgi:hypothetical protein
VSEALAEDNPEVELNPKTGQPYQRSKAWRDAQSRTWQAKAEALRTGKPMPPKAKAGRKKAVVATDYREGLLALIGLPIMILRMLGNFFPSLTRDAAALAIHRPVLAEATNSAAQTNPRLAAALDRVLAVGPYGELIGVATIIGLQIAANHGRIPACPSMGILTEDQLEIVLAEMDHKAKATK